MHFAPRLLAAACALSCVCAPAFAAAPTPAKLTPKDNALHILQKGLKSADFTSRGMAYRSLALDKTNKEAKKQLEDGMQDPQWAVRKGVAEAFFALGDPRWKQLVHDALVMPVLSPYEVLPVLDNLPDAAAFGLLMDVWADKEHTQHDKIGAALVGRNRPNIGDFLKVALGSKDPMVQQSALKCLALLDPVLHTKALETVAKAHGGEDPVVKILADIATASDERTGVTYLMPVKPKDAALAARVVVLRAVHGDRSVSKALLKICQTTTGAEQLAALAAFKRVADKSDIEGVKTILRGVSSPALLFAVYEILARLGDRSMALDAQKLAESTDVEVRATGVFYLGWVGGAARLREMHEYLHDGIPAVRVASARVIGYIASPVSVPALRDALDNERDEGVRIELIKALAGIKDRAAYEGLMFYTREHDDELRRLVVRALAESGDPVARQGLLNALNDNSVRIRTEAVRGFLLSDPAEAVRVWKKAIRWLPRGAVIALTREMDKTMEGFLQIALFEAGLDDIGIAMREEALLALHLLPQAEAPMLHKVLDTTDDDDLRVRVLGRLFDLEGKKLATEIKYMAEKSGIRARLAAIRLLGKLKGDKEATDALARFQDDLDERIRIAASLTLIGG